eukprot:1469785-Rhodomonas_salina.1
MPTRIGRVSESLDATAKWRANNVSWQVITTGWSSGGRTIVAARAARTTWTSASSSPASRSACSRRQSLTSRRTWHSRFTCSGTGASVSPHRPFDAMNKSDAPAVRKSACRGRRISGRVVSAPSDDRSPSAGGLIGTTTLATRLTAFGHDAWPTCGRSSLASARPGLRSSRAPCTRSEVTSAGGSLLAPAVAAGALFLGAPLLPDP